MIFIYSILLIYITWVFFTAVMRLREVRDAGRLEFTKHPIRFLFSYVTLFFGLLLDTAVNWIICTVIGIEFPKEFLTTARLNRWYSSTNESGLARYRKLLAKWFGEELLDEIDPDGKHVKG